jgi:mono/diheme cytochrome c family protein
MDFPLFFVDGIGNRLLFAIIAVTHVLINHPLAVGAYPLVTLMEWRAYRRGDASLDDVARRVTFVFFIITTTLGALTGVGIWLGAALIAPFGIGSLLRVFFWAWFIEWIIFIIEVGLVLIYYLQWKRWSVGPRKKLHIGVGVALSLFSWGTMIIITAILGFMMGIGSWAPSDSFITGFFNPLYFPQLAFRTCFAMMGAGLFVWFLVFFFTKRNLDIRHRTVRFVSRWVLGWTIPTALAAVWYYRAIPRQMIDNLGVALLTMKYSVWEGTFLIIVAGVIGVIVLTAIIGATRPRWIPQVLLIIPFVLGLYMLGHFERVREFIRKPHVIADYMYSNGVRMSELPIFQRDGMLTYATYVRHKRVTDDNKVEAGEDVFVLACSRCHTTTGVNGIIKRFENLYGPDPWDSEVLTGYIATMHNTRTFMPPFPGNQKEREALAAYIQQLRVTGLPVLGVQSAGIPQRLAGGTQ